MDDVMLMRAPAEQEGERVNGIRIAAQVLRWLANRSSCPDCRMPRGKPHREECEVQALLGGAETADAEGAAFTLGVAPESGCVTLNVPQAGLYALSPDQADELAADLRNYAVELRNGGRVG